MFGIGWKTVSTYSHIRLDAMMKFPQNNTANNIHICTYSKYTHKYCTYKTYKHRELSLVVFTALTVVYVKKVALVYSYFLTN